MPHRAHITALRALVVVAVVLATVASAAVPAHAALLVTPPDGRCSTVRGFRALLEPVAAARCLLGRLQQPRGSVSAGRRQPGPAAPARPALPEPARISPDVQQVAPAAAAQSAPPAPLRHTTYGAAIPAVPPPPVSTCDPPRELPVISIVASVFRCRLTEAGMASDAVRYTTAEALVVADCESRLDPNAVVFGGQFVDAAHPHTGLRYSAKGVFQFIRRTADTWVAGGYANTGDAVASADAAARLYVANLRLGVAPWVDWSCAAANDGFKTSSVLPGWPGGPPSLPAWAFEY